MKQLFLFLFLGLSILACEPNDPVDPPAEYDPTPYALDVGYFPTPDLPADNVLTVAGVQLGRMLFYACAP